MTTTTPMLTPRTIGETENALRALLHKELVGTPLDYHAWVALRLVAEADTPLASSVVSARLRAGLKVGQSEADSILARLHDAGIVRTNDGMLVPTAEGRALHARISERVRAITRELWSDLDADDLATSERVLSTLMARANARLAS